MAVPPAVLRLRIRGRVQGVGFRDWVATAARAHGLSGWVRNRRDGSVEALLVGAPAALAAMRAVCETGPALARVDTVCAADGAGSEEVSAPRDGFHIRETA
ncbi:MAG: acylphosphatase [Thalassobaculaceae bacterium]